MPLISFIRRSTMRGGSAVLDILFPEDPLERRVRTMTAADLLPLVDRREENGVISLFNYRDNTIKHMVWLLKYRRNAHVALLFATTLHDALAEDLSDAALFAGGEGPLLVPVPMSKKRRRERGYNQTELLTEALARLGEKWYDYAPDALVKIRETPPQTSLSNKTKRTENLRGAFRLAEPSRAAHILKNRAVILLDDVTTTGATLSEARRALRSLGARDGAQSGPARIISIALAH